MTRTRKCCAKSKNTKAPIVTIAFGGALLCFCFISPTLFIITIGIALIGLGIWLFKTT
ncbi:MAG: hypothetical protein FWD35_01880 [Oscillospiraceae bacterium]|nr:hypothetical protein [Oscillospiraceae bacterium]